MVTEDAQAVAERSAATMLGQDAASTALGIRLVSVAPGQATVAMTVRPDMVNGWGTCHGGLVATVADTAFAVACNSFGEVTVAAGFDITFLGPARVGDVLHATAQRRAAAGRSGIYDVSIARTADGRAEVLAEFRGRSRSLGRPIAEGEQA